VTKKIWPVVIDIRVLFLSSGTREERNDEVIPGENAEIALSLLNYYYLINLSLEQAP
jgi:hypothetical protein